MKSVVLTSSFPLECSYISLHSLAINRSLITFQEKEHWCS